MLPFYMYILKCIDGTYYAGHTDDIEKRIAQHNEGKIKCYTMDKLPVEVVFIQEFASRYEALAAERRVKKWSRAKKEALINKNWDELVRLSNFKKDSCNKTLRQAQGERSEE